MLFRESEGQDLFLPLEWEKSLESIGQWFCLGRKRATINYAGKLLEVCAP